MNYELFSLFDVGYHKKCHKIMDKLQITKTYLEAKIFFNPISLTP